MRGLKRIVLPLVIIIVFAVIPSVAAGVPHALFGGASEDAVSSASVILDAPSGSFAVIINRDVHNDSETLKLWEQFFRGEEVPVIMEDVVCAVPKGDAAGLEFARSLQSRLPENQMKIETEEALMLASKAEYGGFDVIIVSREMADAYSFGRIYDRDFSLVVLTGEDNEKS